MGLCNFAFLGADEAQVEILGAQETVAFICG
jgi:hypothetical protein